MNAVVSPVETAAPVQIVLDAENGRATVGDRVVNLTSMECRVMKALIDKRGEVASVSEIQDVMYPPDHGPASNVLEVIVGRLRRKLDPDGTIKPIVTHRGVGYAWYLA